MSGSGSSPSVVPFNIGALAPFMPSVFNGPFNAQGAEQNEQMLAKKYPWITPPAGQFAGAQPGQFAGAGNGSGSLPGVTGFTPPSAPNPPIPPTVPAGGSQTASTPAVPAQGASNFNPAALATGQGNSMMPNQLQAILAVLGAQNPTSAAPAAPAAQTMQTVGGQ